MERKVVILFDGVCNLCNGWVNFVIDRDPDRRFLFGALQSDAAAAVLRSFDRENESDSIILIDDGRLLEKSDAVLAILSELPRPWSLLTPLRFVPRFIRDAVYDLVARNRYSWFGRRDTCRVPTPDLRSRFLQMEDVSSTDT